MKSNRTTVIVLLVIAVLLVFAPLFIIRGAEFGGADGSGSEMVNEIMGGEYEPWFTPVIETAIGGGLPGEMESLLFSLQTGIGVGIVAYAFGYLVARKKFSSDRPK